MAYEHQKTVGKLASRAEDNFNRRWRNPSWWNLLIVMPWVLAVGLCVYQWSVDSWIAVRQKTVTGAVTTHEPSNHNRYGYMFEVDGKPYSGWEIPHRQEPVIGQQVLVYYDPTDQTKNALTDFDELSSTSLGPLPLTLVGIGTGALVIFVLRRQFRKHNVDQMQ